MSFTEQKSFRNIKTQSQYNTTADSLSGLALIHCYRDKHMDMYRHIIRTMFSKTNRKNCFYH